MPEYSKGATRGLRNSTDGRPRWLKYLTNLSGTYNNNNYGYFSYFYLTVCVLPHLIGLN
jgi:hypothetical protein